VITVRFVACAGAVGGPRGPAGPPGEAQPGLVIPAVGLLDTEEGTLEFRFRLGYEPEEAGRELAYHGKGGFWTFNYGDALYPRDSWSISFFAGKYGTGAGVRMGVTFDGKQARHPFFPTFGKKTPPEARPRRGAWYNLAIVWKAGREFSTFVDRWPSSGMKFPDPVARPLTPKAVMEFLPGPYALEYVRISSVARVPEDLALGPQAPAPDASTVLLLDFRQGQPGDTTVTPAHAATPAARRPLTLPRPFQLLPSEGGPALYAAPEASFGG